MSYKVEFLPRNLSVSAKDGLPAVASAIEAVINGHASQGRALDQVASVSIVEQPGCLAGLFGKKSEYAVYNMLVFRDRA